MFLIKYKIKMSYEYQEQMEDIDSTDQMKKKISLTQFNQIYVQTTNDNNIKENVDDPGLYYRLDKNGGRQNYIQQMLVYEKDIDFGDTINDVLNYVDTEYMPQYYFDSYQTFIKEIDDQNIEEQLNQTMIQYQDENEEIISAFRIGQLKNLVDQLFINSSLKILTSDNQSMIINAFRFYVKIKSLFFKDYIQMKFNTQYYKIEYELTQKIEKDHELLRLFLKNINALKANFVKNQEEESTFKTDLSTFLINRFNNEAKDNQQERDRLLNQIDKIEKEKKISEQETEKQMTKIFTLENEIKLLEQDITILQEKITIMDENEIQNAIEIEASLSSKIQELKNKIEILYGSDEFSALNEYSTLSSTQSSTLSSGKVDGSRPNQFKQNKKRKKQDSEQKSQEEEELIVS
jgi:hypothetical protein